MPIGPSPSKVSSDAACTKTNLGLGCETDEFAVFYVQNKLARAVEFERDLM
jgi:hypothetical protein